MLRRWFLAMALVVPAVAAALSPPPPEIADLTPEELAILADGEVVLRLVETPSGATSIGIIDVAATPSRTIDAALDVQHRVAEAGAVKEVNIYHHAPPAGGVPETMGAQFVLRVMGSRVVFHTWYEIDRAAGWAEFRLDPNKEHDIVKADGSYHAYATASGTRLVYRSQSDSGRSVPQWLARWLANSSLKDQLKGIRARAEAS